ncbi:MAG: helix-turn-helix domain-containing protein [Adlercreutzia sp.]|nr:helix-turn-helix domain-containing protein [Adlercreutzia sp.]
MADENKLGRKITTLREAHHLTTQDLADRCGFDVETVERLEAGEVPASLAPLIKLTRALGVRLGTLMDDDEAFGPAYIDADQMAAVEQTRSLQTAKDAGDLSYFSLAAGRPSRHMDPFVITVTPTGEASHKLDSHEGEEWLYGMEGEIEIEYGNEVYVLHPGESIYNESIVPHQVRDNDVQNAKFLASVYTPF